MPRAEKSPKVLIHTPKRQAQVREWIDCWKYRLFLEDWAIHLVFSEEPLEGQGGQPILARIEIVGSVNRRARMEVGPAIWDEGLCSESIIMHELAHILVESTDELVAALSKGELVTERERMDTNEGVTTHLVAILCRAYGMPI